jgi:hypothetical protein
MQGLSSTVFNFLTLNDEGQRPSIVSTTEGRLQNFKLDSSAALEVPASCLPSESN